MTTTIDATSDVLTETITAGQPNPHAQLAPTSAGALSVDPGQHEWTPLQRAALRQIGLEDAPDEDLLVLLHMAQRTGLDPFARQIYMIGRKQDGKVKWTIQGGIDGFRVIADRSGKYRGQLEPEWCGPDGVWRKVWLGNTPPAAARIGVLRSDFAAPVWGVAHFREYAQTKYGGGLTRMWDEKSALMISKCAEALALRKAFPQDLSGIYIPEEMAKADNEAALGRSTIVVDEEPAWMPRLREAVAAKDLEAVRNLHRVAQNLGDQSAMDAIAAAGQKLGEELAQVSGGQPPVEGEGSGRGEVKVEGVFAPGGSAQGNSTPAHDTQAPDTGDIPQTTPEPDQSEVRDEPAADGGGVDHARTSPPAVEPEYSSAEIRSRAQWRKSYDAALERRSLPALQDALRRAKRSNWADLADEAATGLEVVEDNLRDQIRRDELAAAGGEDQ